MNPEGWNIKRQDNSNQDELGTIDKKEMIPGGWNSQGRQEILNIKHNHGLQVPLHCVKNH